MSNLLEAKAALEIAEQKVKKKYRDKVSDPEGYKSAINERNEIQKMLDVIYAKWICTTRYDLSIDKLIQIETPNPHE